jgi:DNA-binding transcriptional LysR family regulator
MSLSPRYKEIQLAQLRSFCVAATEGNFTTAAKTIGLSASTVWQQVRSLERELKARLMLRNGRAVVLTEEGRLLLETVQPHVSGIDSLRQMFDGLRADLPREMIVASGAYLFAYHLPAAIQRFRAANPKVTMHLRVSAWSGLHRLVERGEADIGIMACDPAQPRSAALEYEHLFDEQLTLIATADHPLVKQKRLTVYRIVKHPLILPPAGGGDRKVIDRLFQKHNLKGVRPALVCGIIDVIKRQVLAGAGVAIMYVTDAVLGDAPGLALRPLGPEIEPLSIEIAVRRGAHLSEHVREFRSTVRDAYAAK